MDKLKIKKTMFISVNRHLSGLMVVVVFLNDSSSKVVYLSYRKFFGGHFTEFFPILQVLSYVVTFFMSQQIIKDASFIYITNVKFYILIHFTVATSSLLCHLTKPFYHRLQYFHR